MVNKLFSPMFLWSGKSYEIDRGITVKHPKVSDILNLGGNCDREYQSMLCSLATNTFEKKCILWTLGLDYEKYDSFSAFVRLFINECILVENNIIKDNVYSKALSFFLGNKDSEFIITDKFGSLSFIDQNNPDFLLNKDKFDKVQDFLRAIHFWTNEDPGRPANEHVKKIMIEHEIEMMQSSEEDSLLSDIISSIVGLDSNIDDVPIYRLFNKFRREQKKIDYQILMTAYYAGTIKLPPSTLESLLWYGKLN